MDKPGGRMSTRAGCYKALGEAMKVLNNEFREVCFFTSERGGKNGKPLIIGPPNIKEWQEEAVLVESFKAAIVQDRNLNLQLNCDYDGLPKLETAMEGHPDRTPKPVSQMVNNRNS